MTQIQTLNPDIHSRGLARLAALIYGLGAYAAALVALVYAVGFVSGLVVPKTIDAGPEGPPLQAVVINLVLMGVFAVQHSVMARRSFKEWWTQFVPTPIERSTYVLLASLALVVLFWQWRPLPAVLWQVDEPAIAAVVTAVSMLGWLTVLTSTFLINHFELFGLHQVLNNLSGRPMPRPSFRTPLLYKVVRHPIYLGLIIAFWATPTMTVGHLLFAAVTTAYIFVGIALEERDLIALFGDEYRLYRRRASMLVPWRRSS